MPPRVVFMGSPAFAVPSLGQLAERPDLCEIVAVVTQPDRPAGRGRKLTPSPVSTAAEARGIRTFKPDKLGRKTRESLAALDPDLFIVAAYGKVLRPKMLATPKIDCINVHASLLPRHRGASPIAHAIMAGDEEAGVCIMRMDEGLDTGPVFSRRAIPIAPGDTGGTLTVKLAELGADLLIDSLPSIGTTTPEPQSDSGVTYAPLLKKADGLLDFERPAVELARRVRGLNPWPGTFTTQAGDRVQVISARAIDSTHDDAPGTVIAADAEGIVVSCAGGALLIAHVKPAGRKAMSADAWVAGRGVSVGQRFVAPPR